MTENCEWCGKFVPDYDFREEIMNDYLCRKCNDMLMGEDAEMQTGIGNGQFMNSGDDDECRHCIKKQRPDAHE